MAAVVVPSFSQVAFSEELALLPPAAVSLAFLLAVAQAPEVAEACSQGWTHRDAQQILPWSQEQGRNRRRHQQHLPCFCPPSASVGLAVLAVPMQPVAPVAVQGHEGPLQLPMACARFLPELPGSPLVQVAVAAVLARHQAPRTELSNNALALPS